jgi:autotransporter strand-loop-strand O-heptosyltransferase
MIEKSYVLYSNEKYFDTLISCVKSIREFSTFPIFVYTINSDLVIDIENVTTVRWDCELPIDSNMYITNDDNFYINRKSESIYKLLIQRPLIVKDVLEKYTKMVAYIDSDSVATPYIDTIFDYYDLSLNYPYFVSGIYDFFIVDGRGGNNNTLTGTLEHLTCELFGVDQSVRTKYVQTGYFVANNNCVDFLDEWYWMCTHPKVLKNIQLYAPFNEETILNVLLWKKNIQESLPYIYVNGSIDKINKIYNEIGFNGKKNEVSEWFSIPKSENLLLFFHGEKNPIVMDKMVIDLKENKKEKKLKILYLAPHLSTGGMPSFLLKRIQTLKENFDDINLYVVEYSNVSMDYIVQREQIIKLVGEDNFWSLGDNKLELINIIKRHNIDIVHVDEMLEDIDPLDKITYQLYSNDRTWRVVETCHNVWFNPNENKRLTPDAYCFCTPWHPYKQFSGIPANYDVIEFPIENKHITSSDKIESKIELGFDLNKKHVTNVGLWTRGKNQDEGLKIAKLLEYTNPEIQFHFIGNMAINFKEYWGSLINDLPSNVKIWGERNDVDTFMKAADVFMFNSTWECNPLVLREAISYELPVISRNLPQYMDMFTQYITPIDDNVESTKNILLGVLKNPKIFYTLLPDQDKLFGQRHREFYNELLGIEILKQIPKKENIDIKQYYIGKPFFELNTKSNRKFDVKFYDGDNLYYEETINSNTWIKLNREYFTRWTTKIWENGELIYNNILNYENRRVFISFESRSLGDTIAWIPYVREFKNKHNCHVIVSTFWNNLFKETYSDLEFVKPGTVVNDIMGMYKIGWFYNNDMEPILPSIVPLQQTITNILGLDYKEIVPDITFAPKEKPYKKYVTIATTSTAQLKYWNNPDGWQILCDKLNDMGYAVVHVSNEKSNLKNVINLDDTSIENTMNVIYHSEFFIGLSSGLSWLAWALKKKVVMISNFTDSDHEFKTNCYRVINHDVCNGCWNNPIFKFDKGDWTWCPVHKDTERQFECHKSITPEMVLEKINLLYEN